MGIIKELKGSSGHQWMAHAWSLGFGSGLLPKMPGTWGTLLAFPLYGLLQNLSPEHYLMVLLALIAMSCITSDMTAQALGGKDPSAIVCDEVVGMLMVLPFCYPTLWGWSLGFVVFRLLDIAKPWPICKIDGCGADYHKGLMIVMDDIAAAILAITIVVLAQKAWFLFLF